VCVKAIAQKRPRDARVSKQLLGLSVTARRDERRIERCPLVAGVENPTDRRDLGLADDMFDTILRQVMIDRPEPSGTGPVALAGALRAAAPGLEGLGDAKRRLLVDWLDRAIVAI
jgi:hypothetical protein